MNGKDLLSISDLDPGEVSQIIQKARQIKQDETPQTLTGKVVALLFDKPSLRTRVSFEVGVRQMGGSCIYLSHTDVGLGVRESEADVARVLDRLVDVIVARVFSHRSLELLAENTSIPVINALSDLAHPCQALGDLLTIQEKKGSFANLRVAYVGDGNNIASSLALACASVGADFVIASPKNYHLPNISWQEARRRATVNGTLLDWVESPREAVSGADIVYTDVWVSMGQEAETEDRRRVFATYQVNEQLMKLAKPDAAFMHDMPAHRGEEISETMLDDRSSIVFHQAENRLHAQKAVLKKLVSG